MTFIYSITLSVLTTMLITACDGAPPLYKAPVTSGGVSTSSSPAPDPSQPSADANPNSPVASNSPAISSSPPTSPGVSPVTAPVASSPVPASPAHATAPSVSPVMMPASAPVTMPAPAPAQAPMVSNAVTNGQKLFDDTLHCADCHSKSRIGPVSASAVLGAKSKNVHRSVTWPSSAQANDISAYLND
ncbi:MAG: hypothetical protein H7249_03935 [Chitinophagaceae bacterium]|nr:hypothetical protein [Oligoflexus sp.]